MDKVTNHYFKQGGYISGFELPSTVKHVHFIRCDFHPNTWNLKYVECVFEGCSIKGCLTRAEDCIYVDDDGGLGA